MPSVPTTFGKPHLVGRDHVGVTLDHGHPARLTDGILRQVRPVKDGPLVKERRLGAVKILSDVSSPERPACARFRAEFARRTRASAPLVVDREDEPPPEPLAPEPGESGRWLTRPASSSNSMLNRLRFAWARNQPRSAGACPSRNRVDALTSQAARFSR